MGDEGEQGASNVWQRSASQNLRLQETKLARLEETYIEVVKQVRGLQNEKKEFVIFLEEFGFVSVKDETFDFAEKIRQLRNWMYAALEDRKTLEMVVRMIFPTDVTLSEIFSDPSSALNFDFLRTKWIEYEELYNESISAVQSAARESIMASERKLLSVTKENILLREKLTGVQEELQNVNLHLASMQLQSTSMAEDPSAAYPSSQQQYQQVAQQMPSSMLSQLPNSYPTIQQQFSSLASTATFNQQHTQHNSPPVGPLSAPTKFGYISTSTSHIIDAPLADPRNSTATGTTQCSSKFHISSPSSSSLKSAASPPQASCSAVSTSSKGHSIVQQQYQQPNSDTHSEAFVPERNTCDENPVGAYLCSSCHLQRHPHTSSVATASYDSTRSSKPMLVSAAERANAKNSSDNQTDKPNLSGRSFAVGCTSANAESIFTSPTTTSSNTNKSASSVSSQNKNGLQYHATDREFSFPYSHNFHNNNIERPINRNSKSCHIIQHTAPTTATTVPLDDPCVADDAVGREVYSTTAEYFVGGGINEMTRFVGDLNSDPDEYSIHVALARMTQDTNKLRSELNTSRAQAKDLLRARDITIEKLRSRLFALENQNHSDDFLMKFAEKQASRDSQIDELHSKMAELRHALVEAEHTNERERRQMELLKENVRELERSGSRQHVSQDYIKNVVVKYLEFSKKGDSTAARSLVPVICRVLHLDPIECRRVTQSASMV